MLTNSLTSIIPWYRSIRGRLTILSLVLALVPLLLVSLLIFSQARESLRLEIGNSVQSIAEAVGRDIERFLNERQGNIQILAHSGIFTSATTSAQEKTAFLTDFQKAYQGYASFYFTDPAGNIVSSTDHTSGDQSARDWFTTAVALKRVVVSDVYYLTSAQRIVVTISSPVYATNGALLGVVAGNIDGQNFSDVAAATHIGSTGKVYFVNRAGRVVIDPDIAVVFTDVSASDAVKAVLRGERGSLIGTNNQGTAAFESYVPLGGAEDWAAIGELPLSELDAPIITLAQHVALLAAIVAILIALIVVFAANLIVRPIRRLTGSAQRLKSDLSVRSDVRSQDEIGQLATSFNEMADAVQKRETDLLKQAEALRVAIAEAKEASRLKDEFLAVMSHELRTPLNAIIGFTGVLNMSQDLDAKVLHKIRRIRANGERLLALINDILDISRIEAGRMQLTNSPIPIRQLVEKLDNQMNVLAEEKGLKFSVVVENDVPQLVEVDQDAITKITTNLLSNAFKFTEKGEVGLTVLWQENILVIEVRDTGIGIPAHMADIIFETFRQVDGSSTRKYGGSGLGLSIVRHLCNSMNGTVKVKSVVDQGSTFTVTLPVVAHIQLEGSPA